MKTVADHAYKGHKRSEGIKAVSLGALALAVVGVLMFKFHFGDFIVALAK